LEAVGAPVPLLSVVRLGCDIHDGASGPPSDEVAQLIRSDYLLFVSTIESRKNHRVVFEAYRKLLPGGKEKVPLMVFVGMPGWGVESLMHEIANDTTTAGHIRMLNNVSDNDLAHLYQNCLFTVYPSFYEGWGLPVAESLAYGKFCLSSQTSSLPEVGGDLIEYLHPNDTDAWAERISYYSSERDALAAAEKRIKGLYEPPTWRALGEAVYRAPDG